MATPQEVFQFAMDEANRQGVPADLVRNLVEAESGGNITAASKKGAYGPMQLMPGTAKDLGVNIRDWQDNVRGGVRYFGQMLERFGDPTLAAAAYNAGPGNVEKYGGIPPFEETQKYVRKVVKMAQDDWTPVEGIKTAAPKQDDWTPVQGIGVAAGAPAPKQPGFVSDVQTGITQAIKGGTPTAQAITGGIDILSNLVYKGLQAVGVPTSALGPNSAQAELQRRATESAQQPTRTIGETLSAIGQVATERPGLLLGSMVVPDPTSVFMPARVATAVERPLKAAGVGARTAERVGGVAGAGATGVTQAALTQVAQPNAGQFATDVGLSLATAPLGAVGTARTPKQPAPMTAEQQALATAVQQGIKVPPSQLSGSRIVSSLESLAGKRQMGLQASEANREVVANQAKQVLGLAPNQDLTPDSFVNYRREQGKAYDTLRGQNYTVDPEINQTLTDRILQLKQLDDPAADAAANLISRYTNKMFFGGDELVQKIKSLREKGRKDMASMDVDKNEMGKARLFLAEQLEELADRGLQGTGNAQAVQNFRAARQNIARSYTLEDAFNAVTGEVSTRQLGGRMARGQIVPQEMRTAAAASQFAPGYFAPSSQTGGAAGMTGMEAIGAAGGVISGRPDIAGAITGRTALRSALLSQPVQRMLTPRPQTVGPVQPTAPRTLTPYLTTTPFQPVTQGLFDLMNQ